MLLVNGGGSVGKPAVGPVSQNFGGEGFGERPARDDFAQGLKLREAFARVLREGARFEVLAQVVNKDRAEVAFDVFGGGLGEVEGKPMRASAAPLAVEPRNCRDCLKQIAMEQNQFSVPPVIIVGMLLHGKKGLVLNVVNKNSIGWGIAQAAAQHGATVGVGAQNERMADNVRKMCEEGDNFDIFTVDFAEPGQLEKLAEDVAKKYGKIDFLVHSAAFANREDLQGRFIDTSPDGFSTALAISAYSMVSLCRTMEPLLNDDASVMALSYLGSTRAAQNYNVMGVAKAALEACVRYLAVDLGDRGIRVNTLSPGPINTVAARGVKDLAKLIDVVNERAPLKRPFGRDEVGGSAVYLMSDLSKGVTGQLIFIDCGYNFVAI